MNSFLAWSLIFALSNKNFIAENHSASEGFVSLINECACLTREVSKKRSRAFSALDILSMTAFVRSASLNSFIIIFLFYKC